MLASMGVRENNLITKIIRVQFLSEETSLPKAQIHPILSHTLERKNLLNTHAL